MVQSGGTKPKPYFPIQIHIIKTGEIKTIKDKSELPTGRFVVLATNASFK